MLVKLKFDILKKYLTVIIFNCQVDCVLMIVVSIPDKEVDNFPFFEISFKDLGILRRKKSIV
jgi:hypothetical protein